MVRQVRTWFAGAMYHVTSRGIRKSPLFMEDEDYERYFAILEEAKDKYPFILHSYCLMTNHTHLQIETCETPLPIIMKHLNTKYAKFFNKKYDFSGHVFDKRYGAELLNSPEYEIDVSKYIHLNPVTAGMVTAPEGYPWSSYRAYVFNETKPLIDSARILSYFPAPPAQYYLHYMKSRITDKMIWQDGKIFMEEMVETLCGPK
ncbi:transposase [Bacillus sp. BRMEA1]|uniref:transposase n=1 Tax=Neobacillus endophyticus TaxID=2738405 RepID=UPI0015643F76|nr:transposase [Neobacillus endophyticus]NRD76742.1 transposase [Neobacillus endophyticus]